MRQLKNWDNRTWLSSSKYISSFANFLQKKHKINKNSKILDLGCGRGYIISYLHKKIKFNEKPLGIDIYKNKNIKKNITFLKLNAIKYLKSTNKSFDLILIKQTIHFFSKKQIKELLSLAQKKLNSKGQILIFSLKISNNQIPCFKKMKFELSKSIKKEEEIIKIVKQTFKKYKIDQFKFKVIIKKFRYIKMIKNRYMSCLLNVSNKNLKKGINEIRSNYKNQIKFTDTLNCINYKK
jgi:cyclopropane fatty-acyl-phospholipid synthase-like methyltransferase